jgi:hypothetical protein
MLLDFQLVVTCILHAAAPDECSVFGSCGLCTTPLVPSPGGEHSAKRNVENLSRVLKVIRDAVPQAETVDFNSHALDEAPFVSQDSICYALHTDEVRITAGCIDWLPSPCSLTRLNGQA